MREHRFADIIQNSNNTEHRGGINSFAEGLVIKTYISSGDGDFKFLACGHNTVRGAAGAAVLNGELMHSEGLLD